jgi:quercetin dioxygenase-like cupin family protein
MWLDGKEINFKPKDYVVIEPGAEHSGHVDEETWAICISIPADEGYPDVPANND